MQKTPWELKPLHLTSLSDPNLCPSDSFLRAAKYIGVTVLTGWGYVGMPQHFPVSWTVQASCSIMTTFTSMLEHDSRWWWRGLIVLCIHGDVKVLEHQHQQSIDPDQIHNQDYSGSGSSSNPGNSL